MQDTTANNKRIAKNTMLLYVRMVFLMLISLYTSRVVLDKLGIEDFGINNVVAGFVGMLAFFSSSLSNVTQRFLNIELGRGDIKRANQIFNQHLILYLIVILAIIIIAETIGLYFVKTKLVIPPERMHAALWAYHFALISLSFTLFGIVYNSAIIAHEDMKVYSYVGIAEGLSKLGIAYMLSIVQSDRLIVYSFLLMAVVGIAQLYYASYCHNRYQECKYQWYWEKNTISQTFSFVGWNFIGTIIYMLKDQGINILLNLFCGPVVNAARAVSYQVNAAISNFNTNFFKSVQPQIVKSYGAGDMERMRSLMFKSSKYSLLLMLLLCLPCMLYMDNLLSMWLKVVPQYTAAFTIWILIDSILATMTNAPWTVTMATGNLKRYVIWGNSILLLIFPTSYIALNMGASPITVFVIIAIVRCVQIVAILIVVNSNIHYGLKNYIIQVVAPFLKVVILSTPLSFIVKYYMNSSIVISLIAIVIIGLIVLLSSLILGTTKGERLLARNYTIRKLRL